MNLQFLYVLKVYLNTYTIPVSRINEIKDDLETQCISSPILAWKNKLKNNWFPYQIPPNKILALYENKIGVGFFGFVF